MVPALTALLKDDDKDVRIATVKALFTWGKEARPATPALAALLKDEDKDVRMAVAEVLASLGYQPKAVVQSLVELLPNGDAEVRNAVASTLAGVGSEAIPALVGLLRDHDPSVRIHAAEVLGEMDPIPKTADAALVKTLDDGDFEVQTIMRPPALAPDNIWAQKCSGGSQLGCSAIRTGW